MSPLSPDIYQAPDLLSVQSLQLWERWLASHNHSTCALHSQKPLSDDRPAYLPSGLRRDKIANQSDGLAGVLDVKSCTKMVVGLGCICLLGQSHENKHSRGHHQANELNKDMAY